MLLHKPKAVIFDMDGLMLDTEPIYRLAWQQVAQELGYSMSDDLYLRFVGRRTTDCKTLLLQTYGSAFPLPDFLQRGCRVYQQHFREYGAPLKPGLLELLDFLDARQIKKAIATSTGRADALLLLGELASRADTIVTGDQVMQGKPEPDIFILAAERLQLSPQQCLVLEDTDAGAEAACAAGMAVIVVPDLKQPSEQTATDAACVCSSLHEVKKLLAALWTT